MRTSRKSYDRNYHEREQLRLPRFFFFLGQGI